MIAWQRVLLPVEDLRGAPVRVPRRARVLSTPPSVARFPLRIAKPPDFLTGLAMGWMTSWPAGIGDRLAACSASVSPVTVLASPWSRPASRSSFITTGLRPLGRRPTSRTCPPASGRRARGPSSPSSRCRRWSSFTPASNAMASMCRTAFVEPPMPATTAIAFSNASLVRMSLGLVFALEHLHDRPPALVGDLLHAQLARGDRGRAVRAPSGPSASMAEDIVFAVNIPPHAP